MVPLLLSAERPRERNMSYEAGSIEVRGFKKATSDVTIESFFENKKWSGGGDIAHFERDEENNVIRITFCDPEG